MNPGLGSSLPKIALSVMVAGPRVPVLPPITSRDKTKLGHFTSVFIKKDSLISPVNI